MLVTRPDDIAWLTGFRGSAGTALVSGSGRTILLVDGRYEQRAVAETAAARQTVETVRAAGWPAVRDEVVRLVDGSTVAVDPTTVTAAVMEELEGLVRVMRAPTTLTGPRRRKDPDELALIERCASIADSALADVLAEGLAGRTEREIRLRLDHAMLSAGADDLSFPTIVASGPNGAVPHHEPGDRTVADGDAVVIDCGASLRGYRSDMTRTVFVGRPSADVRRMWEIVREAQAAGVAAVRPGVPGSDVDGAVREVFRRHGVEDEYLHGTGHGVGLVIHEFPILSPSCTAVLQEGEVVTVEPGLYRVGAGGVRIEDLVVVTESGCRILTKTPKELSCPPSAPTT